MVPSRQRRRRSTRVRGRSHADQSAAHQDYVDPWKILFDEKASEETPSETPSDRPSRPSDQGARQDRPSCPVAPAPTEGRLRGRVVVVTGTDTGVGKTVACGVLIRGLMKQGLRVAAMKPIQCGGDDAKRLMEWAGMPPEEAPLVNPYHSPEAMSPHLAFRRGKITVDFERIRSCLHELTRKYDWVVVEGAGGLLVPVDETRTMADLFQAIGAPLVVVSRLGLGTLNHTLLTLEQARLRSLDVAGVIMNGYERGGGTAVEKDNPLMIERRGGVPVLGVLGAMKNTDGPHLERASARLNLSLFQKTIRQPNRLSPSEKQRCVALDKKYVWHPFTPMKAWLKDAPLVIHKGSGCRLIDADGREYIDGVSSLWVTVHGHRHPVLDQAVIRQVHRVSHTTFLGLAHPPAAKLAARLAGLAPGSLNRVFYSDNGSTAVEIAMKMAFQYWQNRRRREKTKIAYLDHAYHGDTLGGVSVGGIRLFHDMYRPLTFEALRVPFPDFYRSVPDEVSVEEHAEQALKQVEDIIRRNARTLAAFVVEPIVQAAAGMIIWPRGTLKRIQQICRRYDVLLIADEVATGFGRTGTMFACQQEQVQPDFMCLAKGLTGGYLPLAVTLTTEKIFRTFVTDDFLTATFFHGHTYTANPLACAAALANLDLFESDNLLQRIQPKIKFLSRRLPMFYNLNHVGHIRHIGLMAGIELVADRASKTPYAPDRRMGHAVCMKARDKGVIIRPLGDVIVLMPPLRIRRDEMEHLLQAVYESIQEVTEQALTKDSSRRRSDRRSNTSRRRVKRNKTS